MAITIVAPPGMRGIAGHLKTLIRTAFALEHRRAGEVAVVLTDDPTLRDLNRLYRGIDRATDVLSFSYGEGSGRVQGDVVVSLDRMCHQARRFRVSEGEELARLVIHGALHLAGLDHHGASERRHMRAREDEAMRRARTVVRRIEQVVRRSARRSGRLRVRRQPSAQH